MKHARTRKSAGELARDVEAAVGRGARYAGESATGARMIREAPTGRRVYAAKERHGHITTAGRRALPASLFALPPGPEERRRGIAGRVPFDTIKRARSGLSRLSMMHNEGEITLRQMMIARARIRRRWPSVK